MIVERLSGMTGVSSSSEEDYAVKGYHYRHEVGEAAAMPEIAAVFAESGYHLELLTCLDLRTDEEAMCIVYQFNLHGEPQRHVLHASLGRGAPATSISSCFPGADWYEREVFDMFGVDFTGHPDLMIWGTLEARVQGADLVILGGLNDGIWPQLPPPDPWLNRPMRQEAGLLLPERRIGLSAHDFQQAAGAPEVVLSRALRDSEAEAVPSRWLNRIVNLLGGIGEAGPAALAEMRARGTALVQQASAKTTFFACLNIHSNCSTHQRWCLLVSPSMQRKID